MNLSATHELVDVPSRSELMAFILIMRLVLSIGKVTLNSTLYEKVVEAGSRL
jgi:hypothetical protein